MPDFIKRFWDGEATMQDMCMIALAFEEEQKRRNPDEEKKSLIDIYRERKANKQ